MKNSTNILLQISLILCGCKENKNSFALYLDNVEVQFQGEFQQTVILEALNDILELSPEELKNKRYPDYVGNDNQWDLPTLINKYFVPDQSSKGFGDDFYNDAKSTKVLRRIRLLIHDIENLNV